MRVLVITLGAFVLLLGSAGAATAKPPVFAADCTNLKVKPKAIVLGCAKRASSFQARHWSSWNASKAVGVGIAQINDCKPSCGAGHVFPYLAKVTLDRPRTCRGAVRFTRLRLVYQVAPPQGQPVPTLYPCR